MVGIWGIRWEERADTTEIPRAGIVSAGQIMHLAIGERGVFNPLILILMINHPTHRNTRKKNKTKEKIKHLFSAVKMYLYFPLFRFSNSVCSVCSVVKMYFFYLCFPIKNESFSCS